MNFGKPRTWEIACPKREIPKSEEPLAAVRHGVAAVQKRFGWCKRLLGDFCSLGPKDLLHPPLNTFGDIVFRAISQVCGLNRFRNANAKRRVF